MATRNHPKKSLPPEGLRFVRFIGKCIRPLPDFSDGDDAAVMTDRYLDWYLLLERRGLAKLPARAARKAVQ
jgi:hypothetical protein